MTVYKCGNRECKMKDVEFIAMDIEDVKVAVGRRVRCLECGEVVWFVRKLTEREGEEWKKLMEIRQGWWELGV